MRLVSVYQLNLNTSYVKVPDVSGEGHDWWIELFKYILCKGSRQLKKEQEEKEYIFKYILCKGSSNKSDNTITNYRIFKYILCKGSSN